MSSADPQFERASGDVTDVISGHSVNDQVASPTDSYPLRPVAAELLAALSGSDEREQERARELFVDHGYLDEAIRDLRSSDCAVERAAAARTLGVVGGLGTTAHLIAALFDPAPEVRRAAAESLQKLRDPAVAIGSLNAFFGADGDRRMPDETEPDQLAETQEERFRNAAGPLDRAGGGHHLSEDASGNANRQGLGDRAQALVPIDSFLSDPSPFKVVDLHSSDPRKRMSALFEVSRSGAQEGFRMITKCFDDPSPDVRNAAALALRELEPRRVAELFSQALETASPERGRNIGNAMVASGLAAEAINDLSGEDRERAYNGLCLLSVMAKVSAVQPLVQAIEEHESIRVRAAAMRLLSLSGQMDIAEAAVKRRLGI